MKIPKQKIQQYFSLKSNRAVDIIFSQNKIDYIHDFYTNLQQNKKNNTLALRQTLQNNYEKMLYCTELLEKVRKYGNSIQEVATQIQKEIKISQNQNPNTQASQQNHIITIQKLIRNDKFSEAMKQSVNDNKIKVLSSSDKYYLFYQKIQIINKMQTHISTHKLIDKRLVQYSKCLMIFLFDQNNQKVAPRPKIQKWLKDFNQKSILYLIFKRIQILKKAQKQSQIQAILYQILFQFKLRTLKNKFKMFSSSAYFEQYFEQLGVIIKLYKQIKLESYKNLSRIFNQCTKQVKNQLSSIFIERLPSGEIVFKSELYQQLLKSRNFETNIQKFYNQISQNGAHDIEHPLQFIKQLWHSYFINLIDLSLQQTNPLLRIPSVKQHSAVHQNLPKQLRIFLYDYSLQQSVHIIVQYKQKIALLLRNIVPIIKKCNEQQLQTFTRKFNQKMTQIGDRSCQHIKQLPTDNTSLNFRKYILLRILSRILQKQVIQINKNNSLQLNQNPLSYAFEEVDITSFWQYFVDKLKHEESHSTIDSLIQFDSFFIGYVQAVHAPYRDIVLEVLCSISMKILLHVQSISSGRQKQLVNYTIQSLNQKKQKVTILQSIVVPYLAEKIFKIQMKPISIDKDLYQRRFLCKPSQIALPIKLAEPQEDQFQIGQKQQKEQFIKVNNIGKSIINMGNNLITGFMKKK